MRGMQIKTSMIYHCTLTEMAKIKNMNTPSVGKDVEELKLMYSWWECKIIQQLCKNLVVSLQSKHGSAIPSSHFTPKYLLKINMLSYVYTKKYVQVFIAALFVVVQSWKQPTLSG